MDRNRTGPPTWNSCAPWNLPKLGGAIEVSDSRPEDVEGLLGNKTAKTCEEPQHMKTELILTLHM